MSTSRRRTDPVRPGATGRAGVRGAAAIVVALAVTAGPSAVHAASGPVVPSSTTRSTDDPSPDTTTAATDRAGVGEAGAALSRSRAAAEQAALDLEEAQSRLPAARAALVASQARLLEAQAASGAADAALAQAQGSALQIAAAADAAAADLRTAEQDAGELARRTYMSGGGQLSTSLAVALQARSPRDFMNAVQYTDRAAAAARRTVRDLERERSRTVARQQAIDAAADRSAASAAAAADGVAKLEIAADAAASDAAAVERLVASRAAAVTVAEATKRQDEGRYEALAVEARRLQAEVGAFSALPQWTGGALPTLARPVPGRMSSPFGMRRHPISGVTKPHTGTDYAAPCGTTILSAAAGQVLSAAYSRGYGYRTVVRHGGGAVLTTYNHQQQLGVVPGQVVAAGEAIGVVGTTGYSTGCHLHFEVLLDGSYVDPAPLVGP